MTTHIDGQTLLFGNIYHCNERIRGRDSDNPYPSKPGFDIIRDVTLFHPGPDGPSIGLRAYNERDHAVCVLYTEGRLPAGLPTVRVAIDGDLQDLTPRERHSGPSWQVPAGKKLDAWLGGEKFDQKDLRFGFISVTWTRPGRKPR